MRLLRCWMLWLLVVAVVPRVVFFVELRASPTYEHPEGGDSILYDAIASGAPEPTRAYFHSPLYQWFVDGVYRVFGRNLTAVRVLQHALGCMTVLVVWATTRALFGSEAIAFLAGLLQALLGPTIFAEGQLMVDAVMPLLVALVPLLAVAYSRAPRTRSVAALGLAVGLAALARAVVLLWLPLLAVWIWRGEGRGRRRLAHALVLVAAIALPIAPVTARNFIVEHELVLITSNAGLNLYVGNGPNATGAYALPDGVWFLPGDPQGDFAGYAVATRELGRRPSSGELSSWWAHKAYAWACVHPRRELELAFAKLKLLVNAYEYPQLYNYYGYWLICPILRALPGAAWVIAPALVGLVSILVRRRGAALLAALLAIVYGCSFVPFFVVDRYRLAWLPLLAPFAAVALAALARAVVDRRWRAAGALGLGVGLVACAALVHIDGPSVAAQYGLFGDARLAVADWAGALPWYERAAAADPLDARVQANLGVTLASLGRLGEAEAALRRSAERWPASALTQNALGLVYARLGHPADAERCFRLALILDPALGEAYLGLAKLLVERGARAEAVQALEVALRLAAPTWQAAIRARLAELDRGPR